MRVLRRLGKEIDDRLEIVVRVVNQDVALANMEENIALGIERHDGIGREALVPQVRPVNLESQRHEADEIQRSIDAKDVFLLETEDLQQAVDHVLRAILLHLDTDGGAAVHLAQFGLDGVEKVLRLLLVDVQVAVASDAEDVGALHLHPVKQGAHVVLDDMAEKT